MEKTILALCASRHPMPEEVMGSVYPETVDPTDISGLKKMAEDAIPGDCTELTVYVTGLTSAMLAVVCVCEDRAIDLVAMHYDRNTGGYYPQPVLHYMECWACHRRASARGRWCPFCGAD